jgi:hypothetical protein
MRRSSSGPDWHRAAFGRINGHLEGLGPLVVEPVKVGVFFKRRRSFAELRPMKSALRVEFLLPRPGTARASARCSR